jgi:hypothetical protein
LPPITLLASALLALSTAAGFAWVGAITWRRLKPVKGGSALTMFALFWASAAIIWTAQGLGSLAGYSGRATLPLLSALDQVSTPFYCLAAASLLYYVLYLLTGRERLLGVILAYYLVLFFLLRYRVESAGRLGVEVGDWVVNFVYATPLRGLEYTILVALISTPLLLGILAYGALYFRVPDASTRARIALVTVGLLLWVGTEAVAFASGFATTATGEKTRRAAALLGTVLVVLAYQWLPR